MSKVKSILNLRHQFRTYLREPQLTADEIGLALARSGLIELCAYEDKTPTHYRETSALTDLPADEFRYRVQASLIEWCSIQGHKSRPAYLQLEEVRCAPRNTYEWTAMIYSGELEPSERKALGLPKGATDVQLQVFGELEASGRLKEIELSVSQDLTICHGEKCISATLLRFDEDAIWQALYESFDYGNYEADREGAAIDRAYDDYCDRQLDKEES